MLQTRPLMTEKNPKFVRAPKARLQDLQLSAFWCFETSSFECITAKGAQHIMTLFFGVLARFVIPGGTYIQIEISRI